MDLSGKKKKEETNFAKPKRLYTKLRGVQTLGRGTRKRGK